MYKRIYGGHILRTWHFFSINFLCLEQSICIRKSLLKHNKKMHTLWKHPTSYSWVSSLAALPGQCSWKSIECPNRHFWPCDLDLWPMNLTYDLYILPIDLHTKIQVCTSVRSAVRVVTDTPKVRRTDTRCQYYYTRHITNTGCKKILIPLHNIQ